MNLVCILFAISFLIFTIDLSAETPSELKFNPTKVSSGPLLVFKQPKRKADELALYVYDPAIHKTPHILWQAAYHPNPRVLKRVSSNILLVEYKDQLHLANLSTGKTTPLLLGQEKTRLVATEGKDIYFFQGSIPSLKEMGIRLGEGVEGRTVVKEYFKPRDVLFHYQLDSIENPKPVSSVAIEQLLEVTREGFLVITANQPQSIASISREGKVTKICDFKPQWVAKMTTHAYSPKRDYLAFGILTTEQDFHGERSLIVCDLNKNQICYSDLNLSIRPNLFSGRSNFLELIWRTDKHLQYAGPFAIMADDDDAKPQTVDILKRKKLNEEQVSNLPEQVLKEKPKRTRQGHFELEFGQAFFSDQKEPVGSVLNENGASTRDLTCDKNGLWVAYSDPKDDKLYLINGAKRSKQSIHAGWVHDLKWLDNVEQLRHEPTKE